MHIYIQRLLTILPPALVALIAGTLWYRIFNKGLVPKERWLTIVTILLLLLWITYGLTMLDTMEHAKGILYGAKKMLKLSLFLIVPSTFINTLYHKRDFKSCLIDVAYQIGSLVIIGVMIYGIKISL